MSGAAFILIITLCIAALFSASFAGIALYDRRCEAARWYAATYAVGMVYAILEFLLPYFADLRLGGFMGHMAFLLTLTLLNVGIARQYQVALPVTTLVMVVAVSLGIGALLQDLPRGSPLRLVLYQAPFVVMQAIGALTVLRAQRRRRIDNVLAAFLAICALHYLLKPVFALNLGGTGTSAAEYLNTTYAMISQSMGIIIVVATALFLLSMLAADILRDVTARSETDMLSELLNRRGFERELEACVGHRNHDQLPIALVMCDLDHFKAVNDTYGHAVGDRLIAAFATTLRGCASPHHVLARVGGEEFAAILPGSNLAAGRLFAETVRAAFASARPADLPDELRFSASFGVAELGNSETPSAFSARADAALYDAKRSGRDCVRTSVFVRETDSPSQGADQPLTSPSNDVANRYFASSSRDR